MILALDLATLTGFAYGPGDTGELPTIGSHRLPSTGDDVGRFLAAYRDWLVAKVSEVEPDLLVMEAPILHSQTTITVTRKLQGLAGVTEMVIHDLNATYRKIGAAEIEVAEVATTSVKKALTGNGRAEKSDMIRAAQIYGLDPACSDEADAFGVWLLTVRTRWPKLAHHWDPLQFSRGRLVA